MVCWNAWFWLATRDLNHAALPAAAAPDMAYTPELFANPG